MRPTRPPHIPGISNRWTTTLLATLLTWVPLAHAEEPTAQPAPYWQIKVDFLEPVVNLGGIVRVDHGIGHHAVGLVLGAGGRVSEFDNAQFEQYQDRTLVQAGVEYQYFLSKKKDRGFFVGADAMFALHSVDSKSTAETVAGIPVFTPGAWLGWVWVPKGNHLVIDLTIVHPRYNLGPIRSVAFKTVSEPYEPENLFNFLGPWSIGWRF